MWALDPATGAVLRENGRRKRVDGASEILQHVRVRLRLFKFVVKGQIRAETPLNADLCMATGEIFRKGVDLGDVEGEIYGQIQDTPGIVSVERVDARLNGSTRVLAVDFAATASVENKRQRIPIHDRFTYRV